AKRTVTEGELPKGRLKSDAAVLHDDHGGPRPRNSKPPSREAEQEGTRARGWLWLGRRIAGRCRRDGQRFVDLDTRVADIPESTVWVFLQTTPQQVPNARWDRWRKCRPVSVPLENARDGIRYRLATECRTSGEHLEED